MKKLSVLLVSVLIAITSFAFNEPIAQLNLTAFNNQPIIVLVDGFKVGPRQVRQRITNLRPGYHDIKVVQVTDGYHNQRNRKVIYRGNIHIPRNTKVVARVTSRGGLNVIKTVPLQANRPRNGYHQNNQGYGRGYIGMPKARFQAVKARIQQQHYEEDRLRIAQRAIQNHGINARQLSRLMNQMVFEDAKIQLAKAAFPQLADQENLHYVYDSLHYQSSRRHLDRWLNRQLG